MESIFNVVWVTSLYGTVVGIALILIKNLLKNRLSQSALSYMDCAYIKIAHTFGPESAVSLFNIIPVTRDINGIDNSLEINNKGSILLPAEKEINNTGTYEIPVQPNFNNNTVGNTDNIKVNTKILLRLFGFLVRC